MKVPRKVEVVKTNKPINPPKGLNKSEKRKVIKIKVNRIISESFEYWILWIFFAANLEVFTDIINEKIPEKIIIDRSINKLAGVNSGINLETATAAPVLVFWIV